jgi:hypothetical protein
MMLHLQNSIAKFYVVTVCDRITKLIKPLIAIHSNLIIALTSLVYLFIYCIIKDEKWYVDEVSDTTMLPIAASLLIKQFL